MTMITTTYPPRGLESKVPSTAMAAGRAWGFWATLGWFGVACVAFCAATFLTALAYAVWWGLTQPGVPIQMESLTLGYLTMAVSMPAAALVLMLAARRGGSMREYLGLKSPHWHDMLMGVGLLVALGFVLTGLIHLFPSFDQSAGWISDYRGLMANPTGLALFWIVLVVTAPIAEEIIFRGFLMRGWSQTSLGMAGALLLSSLAFAVVHLQYNVLGMVAVFGIGLVLGLMRWRSGSTVLTMMLHAAWNLTMGVFIVMAA